MAFGMAAGLVMALVLLYMTASSLYSMRTFMFVVELAVACALPLCLSFIKRNGLDPEPASFAMIAVSFLISVFYAWYVDSETTAVYAYEGLFGKIMTVVLALHACALVVSLAVYLRKKGK